MKMWCTNELITLCKSQPTVRKIWCDNAKEYVDGGVSKSAIEAGIIIDPSPPYIPCLNDVSEETNRSLLKKEWAMLFEAHLPKRF